MQLRIRTQQLDVPVETRQAIERRIRLAVGRHAAGIDRAHITLSPSLAGNPGNRCRIHIRLHHGGSLAVEDHAESVDAAATAAAWRLQHRLDRQRPARLADLSRGGRAGLR